MKKMTKRERVIAAINKQEVDRLPFSIWYHLSEVDQDPVALAEASVFLARQYDLDFIKMMPFGNYAAQDYGLSVDFFCTKTQPPLERKWGIQCIEDWLKLKPLPAYYGTYGKQVQFSEQLNKQLGTDDIPYVQTIFSPLTVAKKLAGPRLFTDLKKHPDYIHQALDAITETTINFVEANINTGVAGFFFATQCATSDFLTEEEYDEFGVKYDLQVLNMAKKGTCINIAHIHGTNIMFEKIAAYPVNCINWHDRWVNPSLSEARKLSDKCFMGGINEKFLVKAKPEDIFPHIQEAIDDYSKTTGLIITPGCVADPNTPEINFYALRTAIERL